MKLRLLILSLFTLWLTGCAVLKPLLAPQATVKQKVMQKHKPLAQPPLPPDPFLDSLKITSGNSVTLRTVLYPPPPPPPPPATIEGFRVQVFAAVDSPAAAMVRQKIAAFWPDTVYMFYEKGLYKIQVGDFRYRLSADSARKVLIKRGYPAAWLVKRPVLVRAERGACSKGFAVQLLVTQDRAKAQNLTQRLQREWGQKVYFIRVDALYKIYLGCFKQRAQAESWLKRARDNGFVDAWIKTF